MNALDPKELIEEIYDSDFGFRLTNFSIKPVHVANGLGRGLVGRTYDTTALTRTLRRYVRNQRKGIDEERNPNKNILDDYPETFESLDGQEPNLDRLTRLRTLAFDVLAADDAVFPDQQSFTFSNERFITQDISDVRMGLFLARLLTSEPKNRTNAADCIRNLLSTEYDAWTTLALPLITIGDPQDVIYGKDKAERATKSEHLFTANKKLLKSPTLNNLREAYDRLARFEERSGSKLNSLRRLMLFGCFVLHVHSVSRWSEVESGAPKPPILLDLFDGRVISVRDASRSTVRAAGDSIEGLIRFRFKEFITNKYGSTDEKIKNNIISAKEITKEYKSRFEIYLRGGMEPLNAVTRTFVEYSFEKIREHPVGALIELGRRAGFLTPWANVGRGGKLQKRYTVTAEFLETLIGSIVEPKFPLEFPEFLDKLREYFGIIVGRPEDDLIIRSNNLFETKFGTPTSINEGDLRENVERMRQLIIETGYAKAYADGQTVVMTEPEGL